MRLEQLDESNRLAFEQLLRENWQQNWCDDIARQIVQWRYYRRPPGAMTWLVMDQDRCVAMLDSMVRPYSLDGQRIMVRETADWYCIPERRPYGAGLWLLREAISQPEPVIVLGGSALNLQILPKMRWSVLTPASGYVFPLNARGLAANLIRQRWWQHEARARFVPTFMSVRRPRRIIPPSGRSAHFKPLLHDDALEMPAVTGAGLIELFEPNHWAWMVQMPAALAQPIGLSFFLDDILVGFSLSQIEPAASGLDAKIVYLHSNDDSIIGWVMSETIRYLADQHVGFVRCCVSTVAKIAAIEEIGFIKTRDIPCHWSAGRLAVKPMNIDVSYLRGDDAIPFQALRGRQAGGIRV